MKVTESSISISRGEENPSVVPKLKIALNVASNSPTSWSISITGKENSLPDQTMLLLSYDFEVSEEFVAVTSYVIALLVQVAGKPPPV